MPCQTEAPVLEVVKIKRNKELKRASEVKNFVATKPKKAETISKKC